MWIMGVLGCLAEAPEESIITQAELDAAVKAAVKDAVGTPDAGAIEAYLQSDAGKALLQAEVEAFLAAQNLVTTDDLQDFVTTDELAAGLEDCALDSDLATYVPQDTFDQNTTGVNDRLATLETESAVLTTDPGTVVADCTALLLELAALQTKRFAAGITVTLTVAPGVSICPEAIEITHPQGAQIHILGDTADPTQVELRFPGDGIVVRDGAALGGIDGVRLVATTQGTGHGVAARTNGFVRVGPHVLIEDFDTGEDTYDGAVIVHDPSSLAEHTIIAGVSNGIQARRLGFVLADYVEIQAASIGVLASEGGGVQMQYADVSSDLYGVEASDGGIVLGFGASSYTTYSSGIDANQGGYVNWRMGTSTSTSMDYRAFSGGIVVATGAAGAVFPNSPIVGPYELPSGVYQ